MQEAAVIEAPEIQSDAIRQYLTFTLDQESYGIEILKVQEIKGYSAITPIPNTPSHIRGVMNLRGAVIPVVDLWRKFGIGEKEHDKFTVVIVVMVGERIVGLVVDAVSDVLDIRESEIREPPEMGIRADARFINGMANASEKLTVLLDIELLLRDEELIHEGLPEAEEAAEASSENNVPQAEQGQEETRK